MEALSKFGQRPENQKNLEQPGSETAGTGHRSPLAPGGLDELTKLLGPLVSPLLRDAEGALDLEKFPAKNFEEFRQFLITQVKNDGIAFNEHVFASYHRILGKEEYRPLLEGLFNVVRAFRPVAGSPDPASGRGPALKGLTTENLIQHFTSEIISVSAQKFVANQVQSEPGRQRIRSILSDQETYTKEIRADVAKAVAQSGYEMGASTAIFHEFNRQIAVVNYANIGISDAEMKTAAELADRILKQVESILENSQGLQGRYGSDPGSVQRFPGLARELNRPITDAEIQDKASLAHPGAGHLNPVTQLKAKLAQLWLMVVDDGNWQESNAYKTGKNAAFLLHRIEEFLKTAEKMGNGDQEGKFSKLCDEVRNFLNGGLHITGEGFRREVGDFLSIKTVAAMVAPLPQAHRAAYDELKQFVDEIYYAAEMGETVDGRLTTIDNPFGEIKHHFLLGLQQTKRQLWYGYKQHRALSRGISQVASWLGEGNIAEIRAGQKALDQLIKKVEAAKNPGEIQTAVRELQAQLKEDGALQLAMGASAMEGAEQILGLGQTILILLASRGLLRTAMRYVPEAIQSVAPNTLQLRAGKAFGLGFYLSAAENTVATVTGELRPKGEHLTAWFKDSASTAVSMLLTAPIASYLGPVPSSPSIMHRVAMSYASGGARVVGRVGADLALETGEEWIDAFLRARMDDSNAVIGKDQAREIAMVSSFGGGFAKMRVVGEILKGREKTEFIPPEETEFIPPEETDRPAYEETEIAPEDILEEDTPGPIESRPSSRPTVIPSSSPPFVVDPLPEPGNGAENSPDEFDNLFYTKVLPAWSDTELAEETIPDAEEDIQDLLEPDPDIDEDPFSEKIPPLPAPPVIELPDPRWERDIQELETLLAQAEGEKYAAQWLANEARQQAAEREGEISRLERALENSLEAQTHDLDEYRVLEDRTIELVESLDAQMARAGQMESEARFWKERFDYEQGQTERARGRIAELETKVQDLEKNLHSERKNIDQIQRRLEGKEAALEWERGIMERLKGQLEGQKRILAEAIAQARKKDDKIKELNQGIAALKKQQKDSDPQAKVALAALSKELQISKNEKWKADNHTRKIEVRLANLSRQFDNAQQEIQFLNRKAGRERDTYLKKADAYQQLLLRFSELEKGMRPLRAGADHRALAEKRLQRVLEEKAQLYQTIRAIRSGTNTTINELRAEIREGRKNLRSLQTELSRNQQASKNLSHSLAATETRLRHAQEQLDQSISQQRIQSSQRKASTRRQDYLAGRVEQLTATAEELREKLQRAKDLSEDSARKCQQAQTHGADLEKDLHQAREALLRATAAMDSLTAQGAQSRSERDQLERALEARNNFFRTKEIELTEQITSLRLERDEAQAEVERIRHLEALFAERIRELSEKPETPGEVPQPSPWSTDDLPPATVRITEPEPAVPSSIAPGMPDYRRHATPPFTPTVTDREQDLIVARADLVRVHAELEAAQERAQAAEDAFARTEHDLKLHISALNNILANRGPGYFQNKDPRKTKVDASTWSRLAVIDKKGQIIGRAEIIAGGQEGFILPMTTRNGSVISAKTTKGVPKKHQGGNEDSVYFSHFTLLLENEPVEVTVLAGADGAGGEKRGDLATVFLQGVHAYVTEAAFEGRVPGAKELFEAGRETVDLQHDLHDVPRRPHSQVTGAGAVGVIIGNKAIIATGGDAPVVFHRKMPDGTYRAQGYSNLDVIPALNAITNGIHLRTVEGDEDTDFGNLELDQLPYKEAPPPRLYFVDDIGPEDYFTIGSDGFFNNVDTIFTDREHFTGSKEWQNVRSQRGYLLQDNFRLLNLMLAAAAKRDDTADYLHDMTLANMKNPGQNFSFGGQNAYFPGRPNNDNIFVISFRQGRAKATPFQIPPQYQALEGIYDTPPPPLLKYLEAADENVIRMIQKYTQPLHELYGAKVGQVMARYLANLYQNCPGLEDVFNPALLAQAKEPGAKRALLNKLEATVSGHPEMRAGDNKLFTEAAQRDVKKIQEISLPPEPSEGSRRPTVPGKRRKPPPPPTGSRSEAPPPSAAPRSSFSQEIAQVPESQPFYKANFTFEKGGNRYGLGKLHLPDPLLSELHLEFLQHDDTWQVRDLGSEYGSWLNGREIHHTKADGQEKREAGAFHVLQEGDELRIGSAHLKATIDRVGNLGLRRIKPEESRFSHQGPSLQPVLEENILRMNGAQTLEIARGSKKSSVRKLKGGTDLFLVVVEESGFLGKIVDGHKTYARIIRQQDHFWIQNNDLDQLVIRSDEGETPLNRKEQASLKPGDWILFGKHRLQFQPN